MRATDWNEKDLPEGLYTNPDDYVFYVDRTGKCYNVRNKRGELVYMYYPEYVIDMIEKAVREDVEYFERFHANDGATK